MRKISSARSSVSFGFIPAAGSSSRSSFGALATAPKLLLLDEPAAGMNPKETEDLAELIFRMRHDYQLSVLLIEHDMPFVNRLCERVMVLEYGKPLFSGLMAEAIQHPDVISAYLGEANYA